VRRRPSELRFAAATTTATSGSPASSTIVPSMGAALPEANVRVADVLPVGQHAALIGPACEQRGRHVAAAERHHD
jgi:hypothetical protein